MAGTINVAASGRRKSSLSNGECLICSSLFTQRDYKNEITSERWAKIKEKAKELSGLDKYGNLFSTVDWAAGCTDKYMHKSCELNLFNKKNLSKL